MKKHLPLISLILNIIAGLLFITDGVLEYFETGELLIGKFGIGTMFIVIGLTVWKKKKGKSENNEN